VIWPKGAEFYYLMPLTLSFKLVFDIIFLPFGGLYAHITGVPTPSHVPYETAFF
jgi:hypothetical protein